MIYIYFIDLGQNKVAYQEFYTDSTCGSTMASPHPYLISGIVLNVCKPSDAEGTTSEIMIINSNSELGTNYYNGSDCQQSNFINYDAFPVAITNGSTDCISFGTGSGSFKGFIADSTTAMIAKYNSLNAVITLNYESSSCEGPFPTIDITVFEPCIEYTDNGYSTGTYFSQIFTTTGVHFSMFDNPSCSGEPTYEGSYTYAEIQLNKCTPTTDPTDNLEFMLLTTHYLLQSAGNPTVKPTRSPTAAPTRAPTIDPAMKPTRSPTQSPTINPTQSPSIKPSFYPSLLPTIKPSFYPTLRPTIKPTKVPTLLPTIITHLPTSKSPTTVPTVMDGISAYYVRLKYTSGNELITERVYYNNDHLKPTLSPTFRPSLKPTLSPTFRPSLQPTLKPTYIPTGITII